MPEKSNNNYPGWAKVLAASIIGAALCFVYPVFMALGAEHLHLLSNLEFYLVDLQTYPIKRPKNLGKGYGYAFHVLYDFALHVLDEAKSILLGSTLSSFLMKVPFVVLWFLAPARLIFLPFTGSAFFVGLAAVLGVTLVVSLLIDRPIYRFVRLEPLFFSVAFSPITHMASAYLAAGAILQASALFAISLIPLYFFAERAFRGNESGYKFDLPSRFGRYVCRFSIGIHIAEAYMMIRGTMGNVRMAKYALAMNSLKFQVPLLAVTSLAAGHGIFNVATDDHYQISPPLKVS